MFSSFADQRVHKHCHSFIFPDGVKLGDVLDAMVAAGIAENYALANQLQVQYALDVCVRCARRAGERKPLVNFGIMSSWGSICSVCELEFAAMGRRLRAL